MHTSLRRRALLIAILLAPLTACQFLGLPLDLVNGATRVQGVVKVGAANTPLINALAEQYGGSDGSRLAALDSARLALVLAGARVVAADAAELTPEELAADPVITAALAAGVPVLLDSVKTAEPLTAVAGLGLTPPSAATLAALGIEVPAEDLDHTILIEQLTDGQTLLTVLGPPSDMSLSALEDLENEYEEALADDEQADADADTAEYPDFDDTATVTAPAEPTLDAHLDWNDGARLQAIEARLKTGGAAPATFKSVLAAQTSDPSGVPSSVHHNWLVDFSNATWSPGDGQSAFAAVSFSVDLFVSTGPDAKYVRVTAVGAGTGPGTLAHNDNRHRGWYQDQVILEFGPTTGGNYGYSGLTLFGHSPANANKTTSVTSTTGFSVGVDASAGTSISGGGSYTYNESQSITTVLSDFKVVNDTNPTRARWVWQLENVGGASYNINDPGDSLTYRHKCHVDTHGLPTLATNTLQPNSQAVWRAAADFSDRVNFKFHVQQQCTYVDVYSKHCKVFSVSWKWHNYWQWHWFEHNLTVDFGYFDR